MDKVNTTLQDKRDTLQDELNKLHIEQLHKATLNFSNQSLETKKLCVTMEIAVITVLATFFRETIGGTRELLNSLRIFGSVVPVLFCIADIVMYFYQEKLRYEMQKEFNAIRERNGVEQVELKRGSEGRIKRSIFNGSNFIYLGLITIALALPTILLRFVP